MYPHRPAVGFGNDRVRAGPEPLPILTKISHVNLPRFWWFWLGRGHITIAYHASDLGLPLSCEAFTNHYLRGDTTHKGIHIVTGDQHQVAGWLRIHTR